MRFPVLLLGSAVLLSACTSNETSRASAGPDGGTLVIDVPGDAGTLFPPLVSEEVGRMITDQLFDRLAEIDSSLDVIGDKGFAPRLAKSWTWAPDSMSIAFSIDPKARWHDGKPVTASDVVYTFHAFTDPKLSSPSMTLLSNIDSVSVRDSLTPVFWFKKHTPTEFYDVAYQLVIIPEHVYGAVPFDKLATSDVVRHPIGTGRFRFVRWDAGSRIELISDTANYRGRAKVDRVIYTPASPATEMTQVLTGNADFMEAFPSDQVAKLDSSTVARPIVMPLLAYTYMAMNMRDPAAKSRPHPIFSDVRVRRALSMAVDRVGMLHNVFGNNGSLGYGPFPATLSFADTTLPVPPYDTAAAAALLDSAGWRRPASGAVRQKNGRPLRFTLLVPSSSLSRRRYAVLIQEQLRRIGAQVDIDELDPQTMNTRMVNGNFDAVLNLFGTDPAVGGTEQAWATSGIGPMGQNHIHYSNPAVDALLDSASASFDPAKSNAYARRAFATIIADAPAIWLYDWTNVNAINRRITTATMRPDEWWANLADWSIPADKRIARDRIGLAAAAP